MHERLIERTLFSGLKYQTIPITEADAHMILVYKRCFEERLYVLRCTYYGMSYGINLDRLMISSALH